MGGVQGTLKSAMASQRGEERCVPRKPYRPFPEHIHPPGDGGLVLQIKALPSSLARKEIPENSFWWMDAQFLPYNDAELAVTSTAYYPHLQNAWASVKGVPRGRILLFDISYVPVRGINLSGTESSMYPKVQPHPLGEAVGYTGTGEVRVDSLMHEKLFCKPRDLDNRAQRFCAISGNGTHIAVLSRALGFIYLEIFQMDSGFNYQRPLLCHKLSPGFLASRNHNDHVECKWSPDSSHLAISSSHGKLFLVNKATTTNVCDVFPDFLGGQLSTAGSYDFDPRVRFSVMAVGSSEGMLTIVQIDAVEKGKAILEEIDTDSVIDCVRYNHDGIRLAVSFRTFEVKIYETEGLSELQHIDMSELCSHQVSLFQGQQFPTVNRLSFSYDGRFLATSSCDGFVRVWSTPRMLTLQEWCRKAVLQHIPIIKVRKCDLPQKIKSFLMSEFF